MRDYEIVSTDSHLEVSPDQWRSYVDAEFKDYVPKVVQLPTGGDAWLMPGKSNPIPLGLNFSAGRGWENLKTSGLSYADGLVGAGDAKQRLSEMDQDGVDAELLFPAVSGQRTLDVAAIPGEAYVAIARGYNDWLSSTPPPIPTGCSASPSCRARPSTTRSPSSSGWRRCPACAASCCTSGPTARRHPSPTKTTASGLARWSSTSRSPRTSASAAGLLPRTRPVPKPRPAVGSRS
jgi:hypothetical protein